MPSLQELATQLQEKNIALIAHYYTDPLVQDLAKLSQGCVGDSLEMARFGHDHPAQTLMVAGVKFMAETAKILSPDKTVYLLDQDATCSLDIHCPSEAFAAFKAQHPNRVVVVYANTSAAVKAQADWVITSSIALDVVRHLHNQGKKILWAPDKYLGHWIQSQTQADMVIWDGACVVHEEFKAKELAALQAQHPEALTLVHPESPADVIALADIVGSTTQLIKAASTHPATLCIVATDQHILHAMRQAAPHKQFIAAPTAGHSGSCKSCAFCPWMGLNTIEKVQTLLQQPSTTAIEVPAPVRTKAFQALKKMLDFAQQNQQRVQTSGDVEKDQPLFEHTGMA